MGYYQAKKALSEVCKRNGSGDEENVKKVINHNLSLINKVIFSERVMNLTFHVLF